jgi:hypothetical protein
MVLHLTRLQLIAPVDHYAHHGTTNFNFTRVLLGRMSLKNFSQEADQIIRTELQMYIITIVFDKFLILSETVTFR